ncbi:MAG: T9SS type A sorting domain-containing protein, partial [Bacteroidota bacterium]
LDWEIAGGVVRYYVLLQSERIDEAEAELEALRLLAPDHEVVQTIVDEAADVLPGWDGVVAEGGSAPSSQSESATATKDGDSGGVELGAVYPNPANRAVTVPLDLADRADLRVAVYDVLGREVAVVHEGAQSAGAHALTFDTASLTPGFYVVRAAGAGPVQTQRFSVVR